MSFNEDSVVASVTLVNAVDSQMMTTSGCANVVLPAVVRNPETVLQPLRMRALATDVDVKARALAELRHSDVTQRLLELDRFS